MSDSGLTCVFFSCRLRMSDVVVHSVRLIRFACAFFLAFALSWNLPAAESNPCLQCDRKLRKTLESIQAWRRAHEGKYPGRLVDLLSAGLLQGGGALCPDYLHEQVMAMQAPVLSTSAMEFGDPFGMYEYEMSDRVGAPFADP